MYSKIKINIMNTLLVFNNKKENINKFRLKIILLYELNIFCWQVDDD